MRRLTIIAALIIVTSLFSLAQDPGNIDSLIIATVQISPGIPSAMIPVYAVTDDPVADLLLPLEWSSIDNDIHPGGVYYQNILLNWDLMEDTIEIDDSHARVWGSHDLGGESNPTLNTGGQRQLVMLIRMVVHPGADEQFVPVCNYVDMIHGPALFTLEDGTTSFTPLIICGGLRYGAVDIPEIKSLPDKFSLEQNYPNPFNLNTEITFTVPSGSQVTLDIYDILGKKIKTLISEYLEAGYYSVRWEGVDQSGKALSSGLYFYSLESGATRLSRKMLLLK
jgi:hypothetical protein